MDYMKFVEYHRDQGADITVGCLPVDYERASDFGLMNIDNEGVVTVSCSLHCCNTGCVAHLQTSLSAVHYTIANTLTVKRVHHIFSP